MIAICYRRYSRYLQPLDHMKPGLTLRHIRARACAPAPARNTTDAAHSRRRAKPHSGRQPNRLTTSGGLPGCKHGGTGGVGNHLCERRREAHSLVGVVSVVSNSLVGNKEQEGRILNCQTPLAVKTITRRRGLRSPTAPFFRGTHLPPSRVHACVPDYLTRARL
jgi:hypothetical protein